MSTFAASLSLAVRLAARRPWVWLAIAVAFAALYYAVLLAAMLVRFESLPNYVIVYPYIENLGLIVAGTPALSDMAALMLEEAVVEVGYMSPEWRIAEWYLAIIPAKALLALLLGAAVGCVVLAATAPERRACRTRADVSGVAATAGGATMVGLTSATLSWVVCCASPTWVVALAMMGMSTGLALALEPLGTGLTVGGFALLLFAAARVVRPLAAQRTARETSKPVGAFS